MKLSIFVDGRTYELERPGWDVTGKHYSSRALVCPFCTTVWARISVERDMCLWCSTVPCERCPWHTLLKPGVPGSLLEQGIHQHVDRELIDYLPRALLERELRVHLKSYGINLNGNPSDILKAAILARKSHNPNASHRDPG